ncbi:MAG: hypothetical protein ACK4YX_12580, partial [Rhabdaerophilum calidifontis]
MLAGLGLGALFAVGFAEGLPVPPWGLGAALLAAALILLLARGCAAAGAFKADPWVATVTVTILALVLLFVFF